MIMVYQREINLLPPQVQKGRRNRLYIHRLHRLYVMGVTGLIIIGLTYGGIWWTLFQTQRTLQAEVEAVGGQNQEIEGEIRSVNTFLLALQDRIEEKRPWMPFVQEALDAAPAGISMTRMALQSSPESLVLAGRSSTREAVVQYERALAELEWVDRVDAPLKNLASGPEVQFSFTVYRDVSKLQMQSGNAAVLNQLGAL